MRQRIERMVFVLIILALVYTVGLWIVTASSDSPATSEKNEPATLELIDGSDNYRIVLTARAAERLDIQTALVRDAEVVRKGTDGEDLANIRAEALALERRAYEVSKDVYGQTQPAEYTLSPEAITGSEITGNEIEDFPNSFKRSTNIDNAWLPLQPRTQFVYEGFTNEDGELIPHRIVITVTDLTKVIDGVRTIVVWDQDYRDGELVETELAFFAQDNDGNVWYLGEYPEEYEDGEFVDAPTWIAGLEDARAGFAMKAEPRLGTPSYSQGWGPAVDWKDRARVYQIGEQTCVPVGCYEDVLVLEEFNPDEPDAFQLKYYARGLGLVRVGWRGENEEEQETLELVKIVQLDPGEAMLRKVIPYAAVLYEPNGETFAYTNPEPLTYTRSPITIDYIQGDLAILLDGPPTGMAVVTVGAAELYGTETGIGR